MGDEQEDEEYEEYEAEENYAASSEPQDEDCVGEELVQEEEPRDSSYLESGQSGFDLLGGRHYESGRSSHVQQGQGDPRSHRGR